MEFRAFFSEPWAWPLFTTRLLGPRLNRYSSLKKNEASLGMYNSIVSEIVVSSRDNLPSFLVELTTSNLVDASTSLASPTTERCRLFLPR